MEVIILAGGLGTRLRSEVKDVPKCMASVAGKPFLWYLLKDLSKYDNVTRVILSVGYLREVIFEWIPTVKEQFKFSKADAKLTIALKPMKDFDRYGTITCDSEGKVLQFNEKKPCKEGEINGGVYVLAKDESIFADQPQKFSFETDVMKKKCGTTGCLYGVAQNGYFIDIGIPEDYHKANRDFSVLFF
jgi:D-glycero-alpha-D-manno-heptose 1-phosphate guanylyltransferase